MSQAEENQHDFLFSDQKLILRSSAENIILKISQDKEKIPKIFPKHPKPVPRRRQHLIVVFCFVTLTAIAKISVPTFWEKISTVLKR